MIKLKRLATSTPFVILASGGLTQQASDFIEQLTLQVETALNSLQDQQDASDALLNQINAQQQQILNLSGQVSTVSTVANTSAGSGTGNHLTASGSLHVTSTSWTTVASVSFTGASASAGVDFGASGPQSGSSDFNPHVTTTQNGAVRVLENGTQVGTAVSYSVDSEGNLSFSGFTAPGADATTGGITYDLQARKNTGVSAVLSFLLDVTR